MALRKMANTQGQKWLWACDFSPAGLNSGLLNFVVISLDLLQREADRGPAAGAACGQAAPAEGRPRGSSSRTPLSHAGPRGTRPETGLCSQQGVEKALGHSSRSQSFRSPLPSLSSRQRQG